MSWILVWYIACGLFLVGFFVLLGIGLHRKRRFSYFKLLAEDGRTPLAHAEVYGLRISHSYYRSIAGYSGDQTIYATQQVSHEKLVPLGHTDEAGCFRVITGHMGYPAFHIKGPGIVMGLLDREAVSSYTQFSKRPVAVQVFNGFVVCKSDL